MKHIGVWVKLCIFMLLIILPIMALQFVSVNIHKKRVTEYQLKLCSDYSQAVGSSFMNYIEGLWDTELAIGETAIMQAKFNPEYMESYMKGVLSSQDTVKRYNILDSSGNIIASTFGKYTDVYLEDREHLLNIKEGNEKIVGAIIKSRLDNEAIMPVARGIYKNGKLLYIIVAAVDVNRLGNCLPRYNDGLTSVTGLIDSNGMLVYSSDSESLTYEQRKIDKNSILLKALKGSTIKYDNYMFKENSKLYMGICIPVNKIGWASYNAVSKDEMLRAYKTYKQNSSLYFLFIIILYFFIAAYIARKFIKPMAALRSVSDAISGGDLSVRTNMKGDGAIAATGKAFDNMADMIQTMEKNRVLFFQTSAHELRNPMTSIKGIISLIHMKLEAGKPVYEIINMLDILDTEIDRLSHLISEILEAFRNENAEWRFSTNFKKVNIAEVVSCALKPFQVAGLGYNFSFYTSPSESLYVLGDPERLGDVIRNLISNAMKYSPKAGDIIVRIEEKGNEVLISVRDNGIGIPEDEIESIFDSFYRSKRIKGNDPGGMGLGLYICRDIIRKHGGSIWAENCSGGGSIFFIKLPLYK